MYMEVYVELGSGFCLLMNKKIKREMPKQVVRVLVRCETSFIGLLRTPAFGSARLRAADSP
jgi:hypothetical protein